MTNRAEKIAAIAARMKTAEDQAAGMLIGRRVTLTSGKYKGRSGEISGIYYDRGNILALVYVERVDGRGVLNTKPETRTYWPLSQLDGWQTPGELVIRLSIISDDELAVLKASKAVLIESENGYWRANGQGYCYREDAAVYTGADAYTRTNHCGPEKSVRYYLIGGA